VCAGDSPAAELHAAVRAGDVERVRVLLKAGVPPSARNSLGSTPLHDAAWAGDLPVMKELMDAGADLEAQHKETGSTPLHYAVITNHVNAVRLLLDRGAKVGSAYFSGSTALHLAGSRGYIEIARLLRSWRERRSSGRFRSYATG